MENIKVENRIALEFTLNTSPGILFNRLSTPSGLSEWFADDVNLDGKVFTFVWNNAQNQAEVLSKKENKHIRFRWLENGEPICQNSYFEFRIAPDELTGGVALHIIEQLVDDDADTEDATSLWNHQISELKRNLGI